jgi:hypothetical protein
MLQQPIRGSPTKIVPAIVSSCQFSTIFNACTCPTEEIEMAAHH